MNHIFEALGYTLSEKAETPQNRHYKFLFISNPDGSIRWLWPAHAKQALFLKFYNESNFRSRCFAALIRLVFKLKLQGLVFKKKCLFVRAGENQTQHFNIHGQWALFTGTPGPNCKALVYERGHEGGRFLKIALGTNAKAALEKEQAMVQRLSHSNISSFDLPHLNFLSGKVFEVNDVSGQGKRSTRISLLHLNTLIELNELTGIKQSLNENNNWERLKTSLSILNKSNDIRLPKGMIRKLSSMMNELNETEALEVCLSHGDFTPWNMFVKKDSIGLYDWEMADLFKPLGFDLFHFIIQQGILVERKSWKDIYDDIQRVANNTTFAALSKFGNRQRDHYLKLYLIINTAHYLEVYAQQANWHEQVYWLLATWNEALSQFCSSYDTQRELVLIDSFDFLLNKPYAAVKFRNMYPERLSQFSDLDLCTGKTTATQLHQYLRRHVLVSKVSVFKKSYMSMLQVFCHDGTILSFDLINQARRRHLQSLNVNALILHAYTSPYGIRLLNPLDNARYIGMFYILNKARIPAQYRQYEEMLKLSEEKTDGWLYPYYVDETYPHHYLRNHVKRLPANRGFAGLLNKCRYLTDTLRAMFLNQGMVVTFSGVDGAGKSTIITNLKHRIEKQLRRRVVVLRHRPSLLPILSAWTKGKASAEQEAATKLPRTGTNKSMLSSLLRFGYYYTDYLLGQFYVYIRYVLRGYVVIYDRYYFDFMNDSKRSNIVLPSFVAKSGFRLLLKPAYNFFLYAPAHVIRERKQELSTETINSLTSSYKSQFEALNRGRRKSRYMSINNLSLTETLDKVFTHISKQAA